MTKVRCNNCYKIFDSDDDLTIMKEEPEDYEYFKGCDVCKTDEYLMDETDFWRLAFMKTEEDLRLEEDDE